VLFDIAFPAIFQSCLDVLSVLSLDLYTFIGEDARVTAATAGLSLQLFNRLMPREPSWYLTKI
jgi:hypothetical protein